MPEAAFESQLELMIDPAGFRDLISGMRDPSTVSILAGDTEAVVRFTRTFRIEPVGPTTDAAAASAA